MASSARRSDGHAAARAIDAIEKIIIEPRAGTPEPYTIFFRSTSACELSYSPGTPTGLFVLAEAAGDCLLCVAHERYTFQHTATPLAKSTW